jgi:hypothetical protein
MNPMKMSFGFGKGLRKASWVWILREETFRTQARRNARLMKQSSSLESVIGFTLKGLSQNEGNATHSLKTRTGVHGMRSLNDQHIHGPSPGPMLTSPSVTFAEALFFILILALLYFLMKPFQHYLERRFRKFFRSKMKHNGEPPIDITDYSKVKKKDPNP